MQLKQRYSDLSEDYFRVLKAHMASEDKSDQKWATQELSKAFVKMLPQDLTTDGQAISFIINGVLADKNGINPETTGRSEGHDTV